jgi:hypothetical protein
VNVKKKIFSICLSVVVLVALIAVLVPGCTGDGACTGKIEVKATLCDVAWNGTVQYKLTGPGAAAPTIINGTAVPTTHTADCGNWTCDYVSGGPPGAYLVDITPPSPQEVTSGGTITFTLNFELDQDAAIEWLTWTIDGVPIEEYQGYWDYDGEKYYAEVSPCQIIDVHFVQWVLGCEGRIVAVNETSWLHIVDLNPPGVQLFVVNDDCAVNKTAEPPVGDAEKVSQTTTIDGVPVPPSVEPIPIPPEVSLDVETIWKMVKETDYEKSINWLGISKFVEPPVVPHPCVLFELVLPVPGQYMFQLVAEAEVELMDDVDVNSQNDKATSPPLILTVIAP